jgi:hypothetical protein
LVGAISQKSPFILNKPNLVPDFTCEGGILFQIAAAANLISK